MSTLGRTAPTRSTRLPWPPYACAAASFLTAGVVAAAWNATRPFAHGWWLTSFLVLVGGIAQALLGAGRDATGRAPHARRHNAAGAALWNAGALLVPLGVLTNVRLAVLLGSGALMTVLAFLAADVLRAETQPGQRQRQHRAWFLSFLAFMAISVLVGTALAWHLPWL